MRDKTGEGVMGGGGGVKAAQKKSPRGGENATKID